MCVCVWEELGGVEKNLTKYVCVCVGGVGTNVTMCVGGVGTSVCACVCVCVCMCLCGRS